LAGTAGNAVAAVKAAAERYGRETMAMLRIAFLSALVVEFVATAAIAGVAIAVGFRLLWGEIDFATGLFVLLLAPEFFAPLRDIGARRHAKLEALTALGKLAPLLDGPSATGRPYIAARPPAIRFDDVRVVHADGRVALDGFSLDIAAGEHVALVGPSGAGKSTVLALLLRFIEPSSGRVLIDGAPLSEIDPAAWRRALVAMAQTPQFFEGSIADNVVMGRAATPDDAVLREALRAADAEAWVDRLPDGAATPLAERGANLSGGEAQRLALARAIYAAGPLLLFDEPTAHLDAEAQRVVMQGLARLRQGRTVLTIAHRRETIAAADRVVVIEHGRVAAQGTPAQILEGARDRSDAERSDA
ncbi:MAG: ABC transporter ATP-binding protein/permease, partial [Pseudomonadota bacterium]